MTAWTRFDDAPDFTRAGAEGKGDVLTLETACECLTPTRHYTDEEGGVSDLASRKGCVLCTGGVMPPPQHRRALDVLALAARGSLTARQLRTVATLERLAGYGIRWLDPAARGGAAR